MPIIKNKKSNYVDPEETEWDEDHRDSCICVGKNGRKYVRRISAYSRFVSECSADIRERLLSSGVPTRGLGMAILKEARAIWATMYDDEKSVYGYVPKSQKKPSPTSLSPMKTPVVVEDKPEPLVKQLPIRTYFPVEDRWLDRASGYFFETETSTLALGMVVNRTKLIEFYTPVGF